MRFTTHKLVTLSLAAAALAVGASAQAGGVNWSINLGVPGVVVGASNVATAYPVYTPQAPVYYTPQPVYVQPRPIYVQPAPVMYPAPPTWHGWNNGHGHRPQRHHGHEHPVVYAPAHNLGHSAILPPHPRWNPPAYQQLHGGGAY